jgi:BirA family biotin operon repressor/biotin-[acetyl-CoA-carboxylase] ligase
MTQPDRTPLDAALLAARLPPGWQLEVVAETGSTNADLLAAAGRDAADHSVLVAELQTSGRGRLDRGWQSPAGAGLTVSVLVRPGVPVPRWGWLPLLAGLALSRSVGADSGLKWPNDLVMGARENKVAGILVQAASGAAVIGMGINVSTQRTELPVPTASSLLLQGRADLSRAELLIRLLTELDAGLARWIRAGGDAEAAGLAAEYRERCVTLGQQVMVRLPSGPRRGTAVAVDSDGRLVLQPTDGEQGGAPLVVSAGDVTHVRPDSG